MLNSKTLAPALALLLSFWAVDAAAQRASRAPQPDAATAADTSNQPDAAGATLPTEETSQLDIELDPLAFAANGFSVHGGWRINHWRIDVGAFGAELPSFMLSSDAFESRFSGFGAKLDYHLNDTVGGAFFGVAGSRVSNQISHIASGESETQMIHEISIRAGYEFDLALGLYIAPWVSVGTSLGSEEVSAGDDTLDGQGPITVFPTLHLGYRL